MQNTHESKENYLETIFLLEKKLGNVRSIDIANELNYSKPSISRAVQVLKKDGFICTDKDGYIILTDNGRAKAAEIYYRHRLLTDFLIQSIGLDEETADIDACRIEHIISAVTLEKIKIYMESSKH